MLHPQINRNKNGKHNLPSEESKQAHENTIPIILLPGNDARKELDNPQVQGIIVALSKGGSDKYGVSNPQGAKVKINILSSPFCH